MQIYDRLTNNQELVEKIKTFLHLDIPFGLFVTETGLVIELNQTPTWETLTNTFTQNNIGVDIKKDENILKIKNDSIKNFIELLNNREITSKNNVSPTLKEAFFKRRLILNFPDHLIAYLALFLDAQSSFNLYYTLLVAIKIYQPQTHLQNYATLFNTTKLLSHRNETRQIQIVMGKDSNFCFSPRIGCYSWGGNEDDILGYGDNGPSGKPKATKTPKRILELDGKKIKAIAPGEFLTIYLTTTGEVLASGYNSNQLSHPDDNKIVKLVTSLKGENIVAIAGKLNFLFLTSDRELFQCTFNRQQNWEGLELIDGENRPRTVFKFDKEIIKICAGWGFNLFLSSEGEVYSEGVNHYGQLGLGHNNGQSSPQLIPGLSNVIDIAVGERHSLALTADRKVFGFGLNRDGQLGLGHRTISQSRPQLISYFSDKNVTAIAANGYHSLFIVDGKAYSCGHNANAQLGLGNTTTNSTPQMINSHNNVNIIAIEAGYNRTLLLRGDRKFFGCGYSMWGDITTLEEIPLPKEDLQDNTELGNHFSLK